MHFSKIKKLPSVLQGAIKATIFLLVIFISWFIYSVSPVQSDVKYMISYPITKGESFNTILKDLEKAKVIRSYTAAKILQVGFHFSLKQGEYEISPNMSTWAILKLFHQGADPLVKITFPEGFSIEEMATRLKNQNFMNTEDFISATQDVEILTRFKIPAESAQGYLFPSTYYVPKHINGKELVVLMIKTFMEKTSSFRKGKTHDEIQNIVILASIIEKEAVTQKDRPLIASVFLNRIKKNMRLESCATIIYIFEGKGIKKNRVFFKDLEVDSPYNTYRNTGLPPGPIANPGIKSLEAAFYPAESNYLFFAYKGNGEHLFSDNYQDHMDAYKKYIQYQYMKKN